MPVLTYKFDALKPEDEQPKIGTLPDWIDYNEAILRADFDPEMCVAGVLLNENWRGYPQNSVIVRYVAAPAAYGYAIAVSEQTTDELKPKD